MARKFSATHQWHSHGLFNGFQNFSKKTIQKVQLLNFSMKLGILILSSLGGTFVFRLKVKPGASDQNYFSLITDNFIS
tara:strand:+ start:7 stop:240 length:234 start_codon:yes stop_codon:yes gene_type:complete